MQISRGACPVPDTGLEMTNYLDCHFDRKEKFFHISWQPVFPAMTLLWPVQPLHQLMLIHDFS